MHLATAWLHEIINPCEGETKDFPPGVSPYDYRVQQLKKDITTLMDCDVMVLLPNWEKSRGARLEEAIARELGLEVLTLDQFYEKFSWSLDAEV